MRRRHELTDAQWERIEQLLPGKATDPGRTAADNRAFVNARPWVLRTGAAWADLPERFGKYNSIWKRYDRRAAAGVWERVGRAPGEGLAASDAGVEEVQLDSTTVKAHPTASTGRRLIGESKKRPTAAAAWAEVEEDRARRSTPPSAASRAGS